LPIEEFNRFRQEHPRIAERIARNLAAILAKRLILANAKIDLLSALWPDPNVAFGSKPDVRFTS